MPDDDAADDERAAALGWMKRRLRPAVDVAVAVVDGCDHAGVVLVRGGTVAPLVASDSVSLEADRWQRDLGQGPALDTAGSARWASSDDLSAERRWPEWSRRVVVELGLRSVLAHSFPTPLDGVGCLNAYGLNPLPTGTAGLRQVRELANRLGAVAAGTTESEHELERGLLGRITVARAVGMLMQRHGIDREAATVELRALAAASGVSTEEAARSLVRTESPEAGD